MIYFEMMKASDLWILAGIILGGLIVTGYTADQYIKGVNSEIETAEAQREKDSSEAVFRAQLEAKNEEISRLQNQANDKLNDANSKLTDANKKAEELIEVYEKLHVESVKIQGAQNETIKMTIGEGFPNVEINNFASNLYSVRIFNKGNYPIYEVALSVFDVDTIMKTCALTMDKGVPVADMNCIVSNTVNFQHDNTIRPNGGVVLNPTIALKEGYNNLQFTAHARHKSFLYRYIIKNDNQRLSFVYKVYDVTSTSERSEIYTDGELIVPEAYWEEYFLPLNIKYGRVIRPNEKI